ncbi:MAG: LytTR family transcriptional regulator [Clostridia bacterium]|jgi:DNA-binding LytR/AlgR family response regulator|nr:LytTR family transcriptional regulator [Clostridia bacterium]
MKFKIFTKKNPKLENRINIIVEYKEQDEAYNKIIQYIKRYTENTKIIVRKDYDEIIINKEDIIYYFSDKKNNYCKTKDGTYKIRSKLYEIEKENSECLRISKSCIINTYKLQKFDMSISGKILAVMEDGSKLQVSRRKVCDIKDFLDERSI